MFRNCIYYNHQNFCVFTSPHVLRIGEYVRISGTTYVVISIAYMLDECINGTTDVIVNIKPI